MQDRYLSEDEVYNRLIKEYKEHSSLLVAFDFDNTVFAYHNDGDTYTLIEQLLINLKGIGCKLILFTCRNGKSLEEAVLYCNDRRYPPDFVNESPVYTESSIKPYYNILLDDRAGLKSSYDNLIKLLDYVKNNQERINLTYNWSK